MRGLALGLVGLILSTFGSALYVAAAVKAGASSGEEMWSVPLFVVGLVVAVAGAVLADLDWRRERSASLVEDTERRRRSSKEAAGIADR